MADEIIITDYDRDRYARKLWAMSDLELKLRGISTTKEALTLDFRLPSSRQKANELLKESKIITEILAEREKRKNALEEWKKSLTSRREKAILNLRVAASANGQLIAAILEEEGPLTAKEIGAWCEELEELDIEELQAMLISLVDEGILYQEEGEMYSLRCLCTETLFPNDPVAWGVEEAKRAGVIRESRVFKGEYYDKPYKLLLLLITKIRYSEPVYPEDLFIAMEKKTGIDGKYITPEFEGFTADDYDEDNNSIRDHLNKLTDAGILTEEDGHYYFTMLGERKGADVQ